MFASITHHARRVGTLALRFDAPVYVLWAAGWTLASARSFYGYMLKQTGGEWSAPLDDVFIHFDYARAIVEGHPFHWVAGNGYSSGNTSLLYPFVLAVGYTLGFREQRFMVWAAVVAATSVFAFLLATRALFVHGERPPCPARDVWGRVSSFVLPPVALGIGALNWSLWSGMEVAFFLAVWSGTLTAFLCVLAAHRTTALPRAALLGAACAALVATRPESVVAVAAFAGGASWLLRRRLGVRRACAVLAVSAAPSAALLALQSLANRLLTGEWSANGAIVKLSINNPFWTSAQKLEDYKFNLWYETLRNLEYHFADAPRAGVILLALALTALTVRESRTLAAVLWAQILGWMVLIALNGQVRWQNERYTMPAVAWLLVAAALGTSAALRRARPNALMGVVCFALVAQGVALLGRPPGSAPELRLGWHVAIALGACGAIAFLFWPVRVAVVAGALVVAQVHQTSKMRDQRWFFGRASRNIRDQHVTAGRYLRELNPRRVLVGDAGALMYASHLPGLDIIGLGGYHDLPFARAGVHGLAATVELIERMPAHDRPDVMAIYPSWWGVLPTWFSSEVLARFPVEGNVICGEYEKVVYRADWRLLGRGDVPQRAPAGARVVDEVDVADLVSEKQHDYQFSRPASGWTDMKILGHLEHPERDVWDGGRRIAPGRSERFVVRNLAPRRAALLHVRTAPEAPTHARVEIAGRMVSVLSLTAADGWVERSIEVPADVVGARLEVEITNEGPGDFLDYHVWVLQ